MTFEITVHTTLDGQHVVTPRGEIDMATSPALKASFEELVVAGHVRIVADLSHVTFLDSTGLGALIGARRSAHVFKGSFTIVCADEQLLQLFELTGLDKVFRIQGSLAAALPGETSADRGDPA